MNEELKQVILDAYRNNTICAYVNKFGYVSIKEYKVFSNKNDSLVSISMRVRNEVPQNLSYMSIDICKDRMPIYSLGAEVPTYRMNVSRSNVTGLTAAQKDLLDIYSECCRTHIRQTKARLANTATDAINTLRTAFDITKTR